MPEESKYEGKSLEELQEILLSQRESLAEMERTDEAFDRMRKLGGKLVDPTQKLVGADVTGATFDQIEQLLEPKRKGQGDRLTWDEEQYIRGKLKDVLAYLRRGGYDEDGNWQPPLPEDKMPTEDELFMYRMVASYYGPDERNDAVDFEVHAIFCAVDDRDERMRLLHSRDDWTPETAQRAVERYQVSFLDGDRRLRALRGE